MQEIFEWLNSLQNMDQPRPAKFRNEYYCFEFFL